MVHVHFRFLLLLQESVIIEKWSELMGPQYEIVVAQLSKFKQVRLYPDVPDAISNSLWRANFLTVILSEIRNAISSFQTCLNGLFKLKSFLLLTSSLSRSEWFKQLWVNKRGVGPFDVTHTGLTELLTDSLKSCWLNTSHFHLPILVFSFVCFLRPGRLGSQRRRRATNKIP